MEVHKLRIEKITDNKIRIILNMQDLKEKNIDLHSFMAGSIESQDLFYDMLDEAEKKVGFKTKDYKLMIEALAVPERIFHINCNSYCSRKRCKKENYSKKENFKCY